MAPDLLLLVRLTADVANLLRLVRAALHKPNGGQDELTNWRYSDCSSPSLPGRSRTRRDSAGKRSSASRRQLLFVVCLPAGHRLAEQRERKRPRKKSDSDWSRIQVRTLVVCQPGRSRRRRRSRPAGGTSRTSSASGRFQGAGHVDEGRPDRTGPDGSARFVLPIGRGHENRLAGPC